MPNIEITNYASLNQVINGRQIDENSPLKKIISLCENSSSDAALVWIDGYIEELLRGYSPDSLWEQIDPFISARGEVEKTITELVGLASLSKAGLLDAIGWPENHAGTPPFDGAIRINDNIIPFDIKSLCGSGYRLLERKLSSVVEEWSSNLGIHYTSIGINHEGSIMPQIIGRQIQPAMDDFRLQLSQFLAIPNHPLILNIGNTKISIKISANNHTLPSGGISFVGQEIEAFEKTILDHAIHKGESAINMQENYYILAYVKSYGFGDSSVNWHTFNTATKLAISNRLDFPGKSKWLGCIMIDNARLPGFVNISYYPRLVSAISTTDIERQDLKIIQF